MSLSEVVLSKPAVIDAYQNKIAVDAAHAAEGTKANLEAAQLAQSELGKAVSVAINEEVGQYKAEALAALDSLLDIFKTFHDEANTIGTELRMHPHAAGFGAVLNLKSELQYRQIPQKQLIENVLKLLLENAK